MGQTRYPETWSQENSPAKSATTKAIQYKICPNQIFGANSVSQNCAGNMYPNTFRMIMVLQYHIISYQTLSDFTTLCYHAFPCILTLHFTLYLIKCHIVPWYHSNSFYIILDYFVLDHIISNHIVLYHFIIRSNCTSYNYITVYYGKLHYTTLCHLTLQYILTLNELFDIFSTYTILK